ncbi:hypothetical protein I308_101417 [Cryptococcus tetragattii IND107]|uniref:Uncharacterized protein n=1 Tax=Cryptococcus tetragattii IND107 TaxID=1296105 RepID=A0ABR3C073_9TREE
MALPNLRSIFASSRTSEEERQLSRTTFYKFIVLVTVPLSSGLVCERCCGHGIGGARQTCVKKEKGIAPSEVGLSTKKGLRTLDCSYLAPPV